MEVLESLKNISDSDKLRLIFGLLCNGNNNQNDPDTTLNSIQRFLVDKSPEKNSSPKKKQKTLDEWLIKRNDTSKKLVNQPSSNQATKSNFDKVSEPEKSSEEINTGDLTPKLSGNCNEDSIIPSTSRLDDESVTNNDLSPCVSKESETNNLLSKKCASRSKGKVLQLSHGLEHEQSEDSIIPSTSRLDDESVTNNDLSPCVSKESETNNLLSKKCASRSKRKVLQLSPGLEREQTSKRAKSSCDKPDNLDINDGEEIESAKLPDPNCSSESETIDRKNITTLKNSLITKKNNYNLRTKAKNSVQVDEASNNKLTTENNQTDAIIKNVNHRSNNIASKSKYEAFCKLNQICNEMSINVLEILRDKNVESILLGDPKTLSDAIVLIGSLELNNGKTSPIVHLAQSKKKLSEHLVLLQEKLPDHEPT